MPCPIAACTADAVTVFCFSSSRVLAETDLAYYSGDDAMTLPVAGL